MKVTLGIDFSTTNTGVTAIDNNGEFLFNYLINEKGDFNERIIKTYISLTNITKKLNVKAIGIESPSFYSKGKVIDIAAGYGYIFYSLLSNKYNVYKFTPSEIKKFATGKGNAKKEDMWNAYPNKLKEELEASSYKKYDDLVDSYFIAKLTFKKDLKNG